MTERRCPDDAARRGGTFRSLRHRNARVFFAGLLVSNIGTWLQLTAMSLLVYDLTGRATDLGITVALQFLPMLVLGAWAGAVADRRDRRTLAIVSTPAWRVQAVVLGVLDLAGLASVPVVWGLTLALGVLNAFENPARRGLVTELVEPHDITNAVSLNTAVMTGSRIFGPALAAVLVETVGTAWCFLLNAASFGAVLVSLLLIRPAELHAPPFAPPGGRPVREALGFVRRDRRAARDVRRDGDRVDVRLQLRRLAAQAGRRALGRRGQLRPGAVGDEHRLARRLAADGPTVVGVDALVPRQHRAARRGGDRDGLVAEPRSPRWPGGSRSASAARRSSAAANGITQQHSPADMRGRLLALTAVAFLGSTPIGGPITGLDRRPGRRRVGAGLRQRHRADHCGGRVTRPRR